MLAEVLYRVISHRILAALLAAAMLMMSGCKWDGQEIPETESTAAEVAVGDETGSGSAAEETSAEEDLTDDTVEIVAKELLERWLGLLAEGDERGAETLVSARVGNVDPEFRLLNTYYPGKADIVYYAPSVIRKSGSSDIVTLKITVIPEDDPNNKVNADIMVKVFADDSACIEYVTEIGSSVMKERKLYRKASQAYKKASEVYEKLDKKPTAGMHHMGEGSELTDAVEKKLRPSKDESFSIAVRDGKIMYVSWSRGIMSQRYPKAAQSAG